MSPPTTLAESASEAAARKAASAANAAGGGKSKLSLRKKRKKASSSSATSKDGKSAKKRDPAQKRRAISDVFAARRARSEDHSTASAAAAAAASLTAAAVDVDDKLFRFGNDATSGSSNATDTGARSDRDGGNDAGGAMSSPGESTVEDSQDSVAPIDVRQDCPPIQNGIGPSSSASGGAAVSSNNKENGPNGQKSQSASSSAVALNASSLVAGGSRAAAASSSSSLLLQSAKKRKRDGGIPIPSFSPVEELPSSPPRKSRGGRSKERTRSSSGGSGGVSGGRKGSANSRSKKTADGSAGGGKRRIKVTKSKKQIGADTPEVSRSAGTGTPASRTKGRLGGGIEDGSDGAATSAASSGEGGKKVNMQEADPAAESEDALAKVEAALAKAEASASAKNIDSDPTKNIDSDPTLPAAGADNSLGMTPSDKGQIANTMIATSVADGTHDDVMVIDIADSDDEDQPCKDDGSCDIGKARDSSKTSGSLKRDTSAHTKTTGKSTKKATKQTKTTSKKGKTSATAIVAKAKGQTKRRRAKKQEMASSTASPTDNTFEVPRSKRLADQEKTLERAHGDLLRRLAKKPSPGKESGVETEGEATKRPVKRSLCTLCSTCSCSRGAALTGLEEGAKAEAKNPLSGLARSDAEIERALLGRLARLEKSASWFDTLSYKVGRELKKHRNKVVKKRVSLGGAPDSKVEKPRFLADAEVDDEQQNGVIYPRAKNARVARAHQGLFGTEPSVKEVQPTLTQMMRGETGETGDEDADDDTGADHKIPQGCALEAIAEEGGDPEEKERGSFHVGKEGEDCNEYIVYEESGEGSPSSVRSPLADFHEASRRGVERTTEASRIGAWDAATTCTAICGSDVLGADERGKGAEHDDDFNRKVDDAVEKIEDGGIDDLLELFVEQPPSDGDVTEIRSNPPTPERPQELQSQLTQRGLGAIEQMQEEIMADPVKLRAIEASCPNWQDNIRVPFLHTNPANVASALTNVRESRRKLSEARKQILTALQQRDETLALFESSLEQSMNRFADSEEGSGEEKKSEPR